MLCRPIMAGWIGFHERLIAYNFYPASMLVNVVSENVMSVIRGLMLPPFTLDMAFFMSGCIKVIHGDALLRVAVFQCQHLSCRQDSCVEPEAFSHRKRVCLSSPFPLPSHQLSTVHRLKTVQCGNVRYDIRQSHQRRMQSMQIAEG